MPVSLSIGGRQLEIVQSRNAATHAAFEHAGGRKIATGPMIDIAARLAAGPTFMSAEDREHAALFGITVRAVSKAGLEGEARAMLARGVPRDEVNANIAARPQLYEAESPVGSPTYLAPVRFN